MTNLYSRLVSGEDQRTEALADLLERVLADDRERDTPRFGDFVSRVLLADATDKPAKAALLRRINDPAVVLSVATQHRIVGGSIPDMVIFDGSDPLCVVLPATDGRMRLAYSTTYSKPYARGRREAPPRTEPGSGGHW